LSTYFRDEPLACHLQGAMVFGATLIRFSSPLDWVAVGFAALLVPLGPPTVRRLWTRKRRHDPPRGWPWGAALWRGYTRNLLVSAIAVPLLLVTVVVGRFAPKHSSSALFWVAACLAVITAIVLLVLMPGVILFARPKFLIPPLLRSQPGAVQEWLTRGRRRRKTTP
jgi:hypothetical protein